MYKRGEHKLDDSRLVNRQKFLLEQAIELIEILNSETNNIDWELIAKLGCEIEATAKTTQTLVVKKPTNNKQK